MADAGILGDPSQYSLGGLFGNGMMSAPLAPWQNAAGLFGSALKDAGAYLSGRPEDAQSVMQYGQYMRQNQLRQAYAQAAMSNDPQARQAAYGAILANGGDPRALIQMQADKAMPAMLQAMQPTTTMQDIPSTGAPAQHVPLNSLVADNYQYKNQPVTKPGMSFMDAMKAGPPELQMEMAPQFLNAQMAALAPYTLSAGQKRYVGGQQVASVPDMTVSPSGVAYDKTSLAPGQILPNPNQPFNADGSPNKAFQDFEIRKAQAGPEARIAAMYGAGLNVDPAQVASYKSNILAGNANLNNVPMPYRGAVSMALSGSDKTDYSPTAQQRLTTAASKITAPYREMSQYKLAQDGLPYLQRIAAAAKTPGSVSDQDLLDSLTKLNTGGNAVTDAQVSLITNGKSLSDWTGVLKNRLGNGGVLSDNQRKQIQEIAENIYANYRKGYEPVYQEVTGKLQAAGIPEQFWTIPNLDNIAGKQGSAVAMPSQQSKAAPTNPSQLPQKPPPGWTLHQDAKGNKAYVSPDGKQFMEVQ